MVQFISSCTQIDLKEVPIDKRTLCMYTKVIFGMAGYSYPPSMIAFHFIKRSITVKTRTYQMLGSVWDTRTCSTLRLGERKQENCYWNRA